MHNDICKALSTAPTLLAIVTVIGTGMKDGEKWECAVHVVTCAVWLREMFLKHTCARGEWRGQG